MKKIVLALMCICLCLPFTACNLAEEDTAWIEEDAKKIGKDITCGEIVINGVVYSFPMEIQDIIDMGWHVTNNITNKDTFTLEPGGMTEEFQMFPNDNSEDSIKVSVINLSDKTAKVEECMVASLTVKENCFDFVLPSGLTKRNTQEDVEKTYGDPVSVEEDDLEKKYYYEYKSEDGFDCTVRLNVYNNENATNPLTEVNYWFDVEEFTKGGQAKDVDKFIDLTLKAGMRNDFAGYVSYGIDTVDGAKALYQSEVEYFAYCLMEYADISEEYVSDELYDGYCNIAKAVLKKGKWDITNVKDNRDNTYTVELVMYPTDYFDIISPKIDAAIDSFNAKYENVDFDSLTDAEYAQVEAEYAQMVYEAIKGSESMAQNTEGIKKTYEFSDTGFSDKQWDEIDNIIMGLAS